MNASEKHELYVLLEQLLEDRLDAAGQAQLAAMLANSTDARDLYRSYLELHADLMSATAVPSDVASISAAILASPNRAARSQTSSIRSVIASLFALAAGVLLMFVIDRATPDADQTETIGVVQSLDEVVWADDSASPRIGSALPPGIVGIDAGRLQLRMDSGVEVAMSAPARVQLIDAKALRIIAGEIDVNVPEQGIGFRVITPSADVVDLGTAFHVSVDEAGATEVHVSQGLVVARAVDSDGVVQVKRSEAARFEALSGDISTIPFRASNATRAIEPVVHDVATRPLPPGARVVFLGDRTTDRETHLLWIADAVRHLPESNRPKLFNAGLTFPLSFNDDDYRVQIAALSPTHAVLEFGPEIAAELDLARSPERFRADILRLIRRLQRDGIEPILETGFPLGTSHPMSQGRVDEYNTILRALAVEHGLALVDVDRWFRAASLPLDELVVPRGLFPATAGHREIAACIAATLGLPDLPPTEAPTTPLFPGAITAWHYRFVERGAQLTSAQAASLRPDASWTELALPQPDDELAQLTADKQHLVGYRDRQRGFATNLYGANGNQIQAYAEVTADDAHDAVLNLGAGVHAVWLNGAQLAIEKRHGGWHAGKVRIPVQLAAGVNRIVIEARGGFFVSLTEQLDWALP